MQQMEWKHRRLPGQPGMRIHSQDGVEYLTFPGIEEDGTIRHLMTTRAGGVSEGDLWSMNLSFTKGEPREKVEENYRRIAHLLDVSLSDFVLSYQTHTTNIRLVTASDRGKGITALRDYQDVDGFITNEPGIALATFYADCVPLLIVDPVHRALGLAHSGWRGTAAAMGAHTVRAMEEAFLSRTEELLVGIGPSICADCYEVSEDVAGAIRELYQSRGMGKPGQVLTPSRRHVEGKYQLDLWGANRDIFLSAGIRPEHLWITDLCTCCNPTRLYSHRASGGRRGNLAMFAVLNEPD